MTGPPLSISMDFIGNSLVEMLGGFSCAVVLIAYAWWAPILLGGAWLATHWLLRESAIWRDRNTDEVRGAQRDADYAFRLAVDPSPAKELRLFGLVDWTIDRFVARRTRLHALQYEATKLREKPLLWSLLLVLGANLGVFWSLASAAEAGRLNLAQVVIFAQSAIGVSMIAFGGLNWALDGASAPVAAEVLRLEPAMAPTVRCARAATRPLRHAGARGSFPRSDVCVPGWLAGARPLRISRFPPVLRWRSSDRTAPARPRSPSCCADCTTRNRARSKSTASNLRELSLESWRERITAVFQDFIRFELPLRDNVAPAGAPDAVVRVALESAGAAALASLDTVLARGYEGGTDLSGGQWQRVALARALCAVQLGAGWCCSTSRRHSSMSGAKPRSSTASSQPRVSARRFSSLIAFPRCATPTASACSSTAA